MIRAAEISSSSRASTGRQRLIRRHARQLSLKRAVRFAVNVCFRFRYRAVHGKALWSETERVWLGGDTYRHWALSLEDIDIPWAVATATGAPNDVEQLRRAVDSELTAYWADRLAALPRQECPHWLPLP